MASLMDVVNNIKNYFSTDNQKGFWTTPTAQALGNVQQFIESPTSSANFVNQKIDQAVPKLQPYQTRSSVLPNLQLPTPVWQGLSNIQKPVEAGINGLRDLGVKALQYQPDILAKGIADPLLDTGNLVGRAIGGRELPQYNQLKGAPAKLGYQIASIPDPLHITGPEQTAGLGVKNNWQEVVSNIGQVADPIVKQAFLNSLKGAVGGKVTLDMTKQALVNLIKTRAVSSLPVNVALGLTQAVQNAKDETDLGKYFAQVGKETGQTALIYTAIAALTPVASYSVQKLLNAMKTAPIPSPEDLPIGLQAKANTNPQLTDITQAFKEGKLSLEEANALMSEARGGAPVSMGSINPAKPAAPEELAKVQKEVQQNIESSGVKVGQEIPLPDGTKAKITGFEQSSFTDSNGTFVKLDDGRNLNLDDAKKILGQSADTTSSITPPDTTNPVDQTVSNNTKQRGFLDTVQNVPNQQPDVTQAAKEIQPQTYNVLPNKDSFATAQARIDAGEQAAKDYFLSDAPGSAEKSATGELLMKNYAERGDLTSFKEITDSLDSQARTQGQAIQILSSWSKLSPKAVLNAATNTAEESGQQLSEDFQKQIIQRTTEIQGMAEGSPERIQATQDLLKDIAAQLPNTPGELFRSYRYNNMLSSPVTVGRIGYGSLFNTLVTRPADLFFEAPIQAVHHGLDSSFERTVYFSDIPQYYKNIYLGLPNAWQAATESFNNGAVDQAFTPGSSGEATIQGLRKANTPGILTFAGRSHSAIYNFFQSLISGGEQARLIENGVDPELAQEQANALADKFTLRSQLGPNEADSSAVKAVDGIGRLVQGMSKYPVLNQMQSWIAPFMRVSTNFVKLGLEHSPLSLPESLVKTAQGVPGADASLAASMLGSVISGVGVMMAAKNNVTLAAPTDAKESELFYASGAKPYSFKVGNNWYPYQYLGPLGLSLMLPAALKDAVSNINAPKSVLSKIETGIADTTKMVIAGTPLPSITGFFNFLNGDTNVNPDTLFADLTSQVIPLEGMLRYVAQVLDPVYRHAKGFGQRIESGLPIVSKNVPAYVNPVGQPETRNISNYLAPYAIGMGNNQFDGALQDRQTTLNSNAIVSQSNKQGEIRGGNQVSDKIWSLPDGAFAYQIGDQFKQAKTQIKAQQAIDKYTFTNSDQKSSFLNGIYYTKDASGAVHTSTKSPTVKKGKKLSGKLKTGKVKLASLRSKKTKLGKLTLAKLPKLKTIKAGKLPTFTA